MSSTLNSLIDSNMPDKCTNDEILHSSLSCTIWTSLCSIIKVQCSCLLHPGPSSPWQKWKCALWGDHQAWPNPSTLRQPCCGPGCPQPCHLPPGRNEQEIERQMRNFVMCVTKKHCHPCWNQIFMGEPCPPQANPWCSSHLPSCWPVRCRWHTWTRSLPPQDVAPRRPRWTLRKCNGGRWASPIAPHQSPPHPLQLARWIWESPSFVCRNWSGPSLHGVPLSPGISTS